MDYDWLTEYIGEDGEVDMNRFMAALQSNPELMQKFQGKFVHHKLI